MFKQILWLIQRMLIFTAIMVVILGGINAIFGTELGVKIGGSRIELPDSFFATAAVAALLLVLAGLFSLGFNFGKIVTWFKAQPAKAGGILLTGLVVLGVSGYFGVLWLAGGRLTFAVERSDHAAVIDILENDTYSQDALDDQLYQAVANADYDIALTLIEYGADVNHKFGERETPLIQAAVLWHEVGATEFLLQQGAEPNDVDDMGRTAMLQAVLYRAKGSEVSNNEAIDILIALKAAGGDPLIPADNGDTPLAVAERYNYQSLIRWLEG